MANNEVLAYLQNLEENKWTELARYGPIEMTESNLDITASGAVLGGDGEANSLSNLIDDGENQTRYNITDPAHGTDIFYTFSDQQTRRINGVAFKSAGDLPN